MRQLGPRTSELERLDHALHKGQQLLPLPLPRPKKKPAAVPSWRSFALILRACLYLCLLRMGRAVCPTVLALGFRRSDSRPTLQIICYGWAEQGQAPSPSVESIAARSRLLLLLSSIQASPCLGQRPLGGAGQALQAPRAGASTYRSRPRNVMITFWSKTPHSPSEATQMIRRTSVCKCERRGTTSTSGTETMPCRGTVGNEAGSRAEIPCGSPVCVHRRMNSRSARPSPH